MKTDWHKADIIAALHKQGMSLAALSRKSGLRSSTLGNALVKPWPKGEAIIATAIGVQPEVIWPERYFKDGEFVSRSTLIKNHRVDNTITLKKT